MIVWTTVLTHLCALAPFGMPYLSGFAPFYWPDWQDLIYRAPWPRMRSRPFEISNPDRITMVPEKGDAGE